MSPFTLPNHYQVLGLGSNATTVEIKAVFRKLARQHHPDVTGFLSPEAAAVNEARYKDISFAYFVLSNPAERQKYDELVRLEKLYAQRSSAGPAPSVWPGYYRDYPFTTQRPEDELEEDWQQFISRPFDWAERAGRFYVKWEWVVAILSIPILGLMLTGRLNGGNTLIFMFSTASRPGVDSIYPMAGMTIGVVSATVIAAVSTGHVILTHRHSYRTSRAFRSNLVKRGNDLFSILCIFGGFGGIIAGHYLF